LKKREIKDYLNEQKELVREINELRSELLKRDQIIFNIKEKVHEQNLEVIIDFQSTWHDARITEASKRIEVFWKFIFFHKK
jgi:hypothetical protein